MTDEATDKKYVIEVVKEDMEFIMTGLAALRRDLRSEAGSDLVMARIIVVDEVGEASFELLRRADKAIVQSNKVSALLNHLAMKG